MVTDDRGAAAVSNERPVGRPRVAAAVEGGGPAVEGTLEASLRPVREVVPPPVQEVNTQHQYFTYHKTVSQRRVRCLYILVYDILL